MARRSPRRLVPIALLAVGVLLAVLWIFARDRDERGASPTTARAPAESTDVAPKLEPLATPAERAAAEPIATPTIAEKAVETAAGPITTPIDVLVVDALSRAPVAGAEVRWGNLNELGLGVKRERPRLVIEAETLLANAHRTTSDAEGRAVIDASVFPGRVLARKGTSSGTTWAHTNNGEPIVIEMRADLGLVLRVVDGEGKPVAGVPVGLRETPQPKIQGCFWRGTTDEQGLARVTRATPFGKDATQTYACIDTLVPSVQAVAIDLAAPPAEPVDLVLPACGSLTVHIHDARGTPVTPQSTQLALASDVDRNLSSIAWGAAVFDPETFIDGVATYPFVEIGLEVVFVVMVSGRSPEVIAKGPQRAGERVELDLDIGDPLIVLAGRLVDERGEPIADRAIQASFAGSRDFRSSSSTEPLRTDDGGRFEYVLSLGSAANVRGMFALSPIGAGAAEGTTASLTLESTLLPGRNDLGDVIALAQRIVASGRVVDDRGAAVGKAAVQVQSGNGSVWVTDVGLRATCDESGSFEVHGATSAPQLRITAVREGHAPAPPIDVPVGSSGIEVVLERGATLVGRCLVDDPSLLQRVRVRLRRPEDDPKWRTGPGLVTPRPDGTFEFTQQRGGIVHLDLRDHETKVMLATIEDVSLAPGERAIDGRLDAIDLRGKLAPPAPK